MTNAVAFGGFTPLRCLQGQRIRSCWLPVPNDSALLGISLQWQPLSSTEDVWHILEVNANSPADEAGLLPYGDYIIGSPEALMKGNSGLAELVEEVRTESYPVDIATLLM